MFCHNKIIIHYCIRTSYSYKFLSACVTYFILGEYIEMHKLCKNLALIRYLQYWVKGYQRYCETEIKEQNKWTNFLSGESTLVRANACPHNPLKNHSKISVRFLDCTLAWIFWFVKRYLNVLMPVILIRTLICYSSTKTQYAFYKIVYFLKSS